jgi:hypothetical protein
MFLLPDVASPSSVHNFKNGCLLGCMIVQSKYIYILTDVSEEFTTSFIWVINMVMEAQSSPEESVSIVPDYMVQHRRRQSSHSSP